MKPNEQSKTNQSQLITVVSELAQAQTDEPTQQHGKPIWYYLVAVGFLLWFVSNIFDKSDTKPATRTEQVQALFMPADGQNYDLVQRVKTQMNDPKSFEHVETTYHDSGTGDVQVFMTFRGKNALGVLVLNRAVASIDPVTSNITNLVIEHQ